MTVNEAADPYPVLLGAEWPDDVPGGLNRYFADLMAALAIDGGPEPVAVVIGPATDAPPGVYAASDPATPLPRRLETFALRAAALAGGADVVEAHFAPYAFAALAHKRMRKRPLVVHFHGPWAQESAAQRSTSAFTALSNVTKRRMEETVYRRADRIIVLSEAFKNLVVDSYGVDPAVVTISPPGVDTDRFSPGSKVESRASLGWTSDGFVVVTARRLVPRMGLDVLIRAWAERGALGDVSARANDRLVIVGQGPERETLEELAQSLGVETSVSFTGRITDDDLVHAYRGADVVAVPTVELEGFGLVVLEALACGTPVIVTDVGGLTEAVAGLPEAKVVAPGDVDQLRDALDAAAAGDHATAEQCRLYAETFSWTEVARRRRELYREVTAPTAKPRIVFLTHTAQPSGAELALARLMSALEPFAETHCIFGAEGPMTKVMADRGLSYEVLPLNRDSVDMRRDETQRLGLSQVRAAGATFAHGVALAKRLRELQPDIVHTSSLKAHVYGAVASRIVRVPCVWYLHDRITPDYLPPRAVASIRRLATMSPAGILANSRASLATVPGSRGPRDAIGCVIEPAERPESSPTDSAAGSFIVGMIGRISPWKGQDLALRAFAEAFGSDPSAQLHIIGSALFGEDDQLDMLHALASELGITDRVSFLGQRDDVASLYSRMDVVIHTSVLPEPFGQVVVEAQSAGVPIIAAAAGGVVELVDDGVNGLLYPLGDHGELAAQLVRLRDDPELRRRLIDGGRTASERFLPDVVGRRVMQSYRRVIDQAQGAW